jgi:hypothetical protein
MAEWGDLVGKLGVVGLLLLILYGGREQWWVFGWQYRQMREDRDFWQESALKGMDLADRAVARIKKEDGSP